jgi:Predicted solute binding protein
MPSVSVLSFNRLSLKISLKSINGVPIEGRVRVNNVEVNVGTNGSVLNGLPMGLITVIADANGYLPNVTTICLNSNESLTIYLKPVEVNVNGEPNIATQISQGVYSLNAFTGETLDLTVNAPNVSAIMNGTPVTVYEVSQGNYSIDLKFSKPGVYNLTIIYGDPEIVYLINVMQSTSTSTSTSSTSTTQSSSQSSTTQINTSTGSKTTTPSSTNTTFPTSSGSQTGSQISSYSTSSPLTFISFLPVLVIAVIIVLAIAIAIFIRRR